MRRRLPALLVVSLVLLVALPAQAAPIVEASAGKGGVTVAIHADELVPHDGDGAPAPETPQPPALPGPARKLLQSVDDAPPAAPAAPALVVLAKWTQPAVRGASDFVAAVGLVSEGGEWAGVYWVEAGDLSLAPRLERVDHEGRILLLRANATALSGAALHATYHFLGADGSHLVVELPGIDILDERPHEPRVAVGGAAVGKSWPGLPDVLFVSVWNLFDDARIAGFTILDAQGAPLQDWTAGGCHSATWDARESEAGCRVLFTVPYEGATLVTWHELADGGRVEHERLDLAALRERPHVFGSA